VAARDEIVSFCDELLEADSFEDYCPNGLQVPGGAGVTAIASAVSANRETLERAVSAPGPAELVLVHHGLFWDSHRRSLTPAMVERLRVLLSADASLLAYHLPLDAHPLVGNNALLCERLGFSPRGRLGEAKGAKIGVIGEAADGMPIDELVNRVLRLLGREPLVQGQGPESVRTVGFVSGGGAGFIAEAASLGLDALLTGEPAEHAMADARESGLYFIAAGHYATETLGVRRLGDLVAERFGVEHEFIDVPNPV
jgi:dinuclear metal center YbgI/SA1388 family protein